MTTELVAQEKLDEAGCLNCFTVYQLLLIQTQLLFDILNGAGTMTTFDQAQSKLNDANCLSCFTSYQLQLIQSQLLFDISSGGSGGASCLLCGAINPVAAPTCTCALYYNTANGSFWYWDNGLLTWVMLIGG